MADIKLPPPPLLPFPQNDKEAELYKTLDEYLNTLRQTLIEVIEELP